MAHDTHFLERLERLDGKHLEGALALYRDPEFVRMVLSDSKISDRADRIALSLNSTTDGPFVIVTRDGHFVTCLGEGMNPGNIPVVPRGKLDVLLARMDVYRERMAVCDRMSEKYGRGSRLWRKVLNAGHMLTREEFIAASAVLPMVQGDLWTIVLRALKPSLEAATTLVRADVYKTLHKPNEYYTTLLQRLWADTWRVADLTVLATMDGELHPVIATAFEDENIRTTTVGFLAYYYGAMAQVVRGTWAAGRAGKTTLRIFKTMHANSTEFFEHVGSTGALWAIGLRHTKLAAEVQKVLDRPTPFSARVSAEVASKGAEPGPLLQAYTIEELRLLGDDAFLIESKSLFWEAYPVLRDTFPTPDDIPADFIRTMMANPTKSIYVEPLQWSELMRFPVAAVARCPPELLYFEEKWTKLMLRPLTLDLIRTTLIDPLYKIEVHFRRRTIAKSTKVSRNDPCSCGSGKKYKKCCEAVKK